MCFWYDGVVGWCWWLIVWNIWLGFGDGDWGFFGGCLDIGELGGIGDVGLLLRFFVFKFWVCIDCLIFKVCVIDEG